MPSSTHTVALMVLAERQYRNAQTIAKGDKACPRMDGGQSDEGARVRGSSGDLDAEISKKRDKRE